MMIKTIPWNSVEHLKTEEDIQMYLEACMEDAGDDPAAIIHALSIIARAEGMSRVAQNAGLTIERIEEALAQNGNPTFATMAQITKALGFRLTLEPLTPQK